MNTILIISVFLLAVAAFTIHRRNRRPQPKELNTLPEPRSFDGLFAEQHAEEARQRAQAEAERRLEEERQCLLDRAAQGDETALYEAHNLGDAAVYHKVLQSLVAQADGGEEALRSIAEYIVDSRVLRSSGDLATTMIGQWSRSLDQRSFADMLCLAALSGEVAVFKRAVEVSMKRFGEGHLPQLSSRDFLETVESAYWLAPSEVRYSGSGFLLKRLIVDVRRELAAAPRRSV
jgi:hypothetical protein